MSGHTAGLLAQCCTRPGLSQRDNGRGGGGVLLSTCFQGTRARGADRVIWGWATCGFLGASPVGVPYPSFGIRGSVPWPPGRNPECLLGVEAGDRSLPSEGQRSPCPVSEGRVFQASDILVPPSSQERPNSGMAATIYVLNIFKLARLQIVIFFLKNWAYFFFPSVRIFWKHNAKERSLENYSPPSHPRFSAVWFLFPEPSQVPLLLCVLLETYCAFVNPTPDRQSENTFFKKKNLISKPPYVENEPQVSSLEGNCKNK